MWAPIAVLAMAILVTVSGADLQSALSVGRRAEAERARFHNRYIVVLNDATVERMEVVTEFRRAVLAAEERARIGDYMFSVPQLETALRPFHNQVSVQARLRFHPQNVLTSIPRYEIRVGDIGDRLLALGPVDRQPIYTQGSEGSGQALIGATIAIAYDAGIVGQGRYPLTVVLDGHLVAGTTFDFAAVQ